MTFIHPAKLSSIQGLEIRAKTIVEGFLSGLHKSPFHGFSVEFSEYRSYNKGDSPRFIDWKIYGKTDKLMIKKYEADTNLYTHLVFDISSSMNFQSQDISKIDYAKNLVAAIAYLLTRQNDAVGLSIFTKNLNSIFPPSTGRSHLNLILRFIDQLSGREETNIFNTLSQLGKKINKRGLIVLITDFLGEQERVSSHLSYLKKYGHDVVLFHILDEAEINLGYQGRSLFIDMETKEEINITPEIIKEKYQKLVQKYLSILQKICAIHQIDYHTVKTSDYYEQHLLEFLNKRQRAY